MSKSDREIMEILEAFDLTRCPWSAAQLVGCDPKTVARYAARRDAGGEVSSPRRRPRAIDAFLPKIEELVEKSEGKVRADVVHRRLVAMGFTGVDRTTRRAVAEVKRAWKAGRRRVYRPWVPEPGMWLQFDWGEGPRVDGRRTQLFCAWLAWSRFRVVIPTWDQTLGSLVASLDAVLRCLGGVPTYVLTDNAKTVTVEHVAGVAVRHPEIVAAGRHYGSTVLSCVPFDPESKGGVESTVKIAKADLVPTSANLAEAYSSFAELAADCEQWCARVNARIHRETGAAPIARLAAEQAHLHVLPVEAHSAALGEDRRVDDDQTIRFGSVRYSTPPGHVGQRVWCRVVGDELAVVGTTSAGLAEIARHRLSTPGRPQILDAHYPDHPDGRSVHQPRPRAQTPAEEAFLALGPGAHRWLIEAAAAGTSRVRRKMGHAVELAAALGAAPVDDALGLAAMAGRFGDEDLDSICDHRAAAGPAHDVVLPDETYSAQPGTSGWHRFGQHPSDDPQHDHRRGGR